VGTVAFVALTASTLGWVRAGLAGTAQGNLLAVQFQLLSRQVASIFLPTINALTDGIQRLRVWMEGLTGVQQKLIQHFLEGSIATLAVIKILPFLSAGLRLVGDAFKLLGIDIAAMLSSTGIGALLPLFGALLTAFTG